MEKDKEERHALNSDYLMVRAWLPVGGQPQYATVFQSSLYLKLYSFSELTEKKNSKIKPTRKVV